MIPPQALKKRLNYFGNIRWLSVMNGFFGLETKNESNVMNKADVRLTIILFICLISSTLPLAYNKLFGKAYDLSKDIVPETTIQGIR